MAPEPFIQTVSGQRINPFAPDPAAIDIGDIAHALANQCRFGGHCRRFYSVAQHSCLVADVAAGRGADRDAALWALLHDAAEAYLGDVPHPVKHNSELGRIYRDAERGVHDAILQRFGLPLTAPPVVAEVDRALLAAEREALMVAAWDWPELEGIKAAEVAIEPWHPERAAREFLGRYERLNSVPD
jgi:5'-deoxynucleotidase YfbR-like HD superfamily hydrolase